MGRALAIHRFIAILLPTALLTVAGIIFDSEALPMDASLRSEPESDIIRFTTSGQAFPKHLVRRTGAQEVTVVFTGAEADTLKTNPDVRSSKLIAGMQPTSQGFKIKLKTKAFGCVGLPVSGGTQLEIHLFSDAIGARWVDTAKGKLAKPVPQAKDKVGDGVRASPVAAKAVPLPPQSTPAKPTLSAGAPVDSARRPASQALSAPSRAVSSSSAPPTTAQAALPAQVTSVMGTSKESGVAFAASFPASGASSLRLPAVPSPSARQQAVQTGTLSVSAAFATFTFPDFLPLAGAQLCGSPVIFGRAGPGSAIRP